MKVLKVLQKWLRWIIILFFATTIGSVIIYRWVPVYVTPLMLIRCAQQVRNGDQLRLRHHWVPLDEISQHLPNAVIASEDQRFMEHHGFDFDAIDKAIKANDSRKQFALKRHLRGGSTISQQTAKNVFLWPNRSWLRKGLEAYFTVLIELIWNKQRIMEVYLNSIEMGDGIYGAEAVAQWHFNCTAAQLTRANCALIAATLPNPIRYSSKSPSNYVLRRQTWVMRQMKRLSPMPLDKGRGVE